MGWSTNHPNGPIYYAPQQACKATNPSIRCTSEFVAARSGRKGRGHRVSPFSTRALIDPSSYGV